MQNEMVCDPNEFKKRVSELQQAEIWINQSAAHIFILICSNIWNTWLQWHSCFWFWKYGLCSGAGSGWERCWGVPKLQNLSAPYVGLCLSWLPEAWVMLTSMVTWLDEGIFSFFRRGSTWNFAKQLCLEVFGVVETKLHSLFRFSSSNLFSDMFINWPWNFLHTLVKHLFGLRIHKIHKESPEFFQGPLLFPALACHCWPNPWVEAFSLHMPRWC